MTYTKTATQTVTNLFKKQWQHCVLDYCFLRMHHHKMPYRQKTC